MPLGSSSRNKPRRRFALAAAALMLAPGGAAAETARLPTTPEDLIATVRQALLDRDLATFEALVNWAEARPFRRRYVNFQFLHSVGRPIRSIALEPFPADGLREVEARGAQHANMPVSHRLRVVFDEPDLDDGTPPTAVFLIGHDGTAYRIALVVPVPKKHDNN